MIIAGFQCKNMASIWLPCIAVLACFCVGFSDAKAVGYNVVSSTEFEKVKSTNPDADLLHVVYFETGAGKSCHSSCKLN